MPKTFLTYKVIWLVNTYWSNGRIPQFDLCWPLSYNVSTLRNHRVCFDTLHFNSDVKILVMCQWGVLRVPVSVFFVRALITGNVIKLSHSTIALTNIYKTSQILNHDKVISHFSTIETKTHWYHSEPIQ